MPRRNVSLSIKLITASTLLLVLVIGLFGGMNLWHARNIIDSDSARLQSQMNRALQQTGSAQLRLFAETARIAILQSDFTTLRAVTENIPKQDERVSVVAVADQSGKVLAHSDPRQNNSQLESFLRTGSGETLGGSNTRTPDGRTIMVFSAPVRHEGLVLASVVLAYSLAPLQSELRRADELKRKEAGESVRRMLVVGLACLLLGVILFIVQGLRITRPIQDLARQAEQIAAGDLEARVRISTADEIGILGQRFNFMAEQVSKLMHASIEKAAMEKELEVASAVQGTLIPDSAMVQAGSLILAGFFKPATRCGGDWWNYYLLPDGRVLVIIGDVTGHGVASAMITAAAKGSATTISAMSGGRIELDSLLRALNVAIHDAARGRFVMTCFASIYDPTTRELTFANAGHNFPYRYDSENNRIGSLVVRGNHLGDAAAAHYETRTIKLNPDDALFWYTDGIVECEDAHGEEYGEKRFRAAIRKHARMPADQARDEIVAQANEFLGAVPPKDDITLVVGKFS